MGLAMQVLLLDEITVDLDVLGRSDLLAFLRKECEQRGATIVYVRPESVQTRPQSQHPWCGHLVHFLMGMPGPDAMLWRWGAHLQAAAQRLAQGGMVACCESRCSVKALHSWANCRSADHPHSFSQRHSQAAWGAPGDLRAPGLARALALCTRLRLCWSCLARAAPQRCLSSTSRTDACPAQHCQVQSAS